MSTKPQLSGRLEFIDGTRGLAVLCMLVLHTAHGWLHADFRSGPAWYWITSVGGMAAPLFFLLTGVGLGLRLWSPTGHRIRARTELTRGLGLTVLGYLLRVQMWQFDGAAIVDPPQLAAGLVLAAGYLTLLRALGRLDHGEPSGPATLAWGTLATGLGLWAARAVAPEALPNLLRFDVLQGLGLTSALFATPLVLVSGGRGRALGAVLFSGFVLLVTPPMRAWVPGSLPAPVAAAIAFWPDPSGGAPWAMFPLFPWAAYAGFGVLVGGYLRRESERNRSAGALVVPLALAGVILAYLTSEDLPRVTAALARHPALTQPVRVGYRLGIGLVAIAAAAALSWRRNRLHVRLVQLGQASLWVYWIHLEFAFGAPSTPIHARLNLSQWLPLLCLLTLAMVVVAHSRAWLRKRAGSGSPGDTSIATTNVEQGA